MMLRGRRLLVSWRSARLHGNDAHVRVQKTLKVRTMQEFSTLRRTKAVPTNVKFTKAFEALQGGDLQHTLTLVRKGISEGMLPPVELLHRLLQAFSQSEMVDELMQTYDYLKEISKTMDVSVYPIILRTLWKQQKLELALEVFSDVQSNLGASKGICDLGIALYTKAGDPVRAKLILRSMSSLMWTPDGITQLASSGQLTTLDDILVQCFGELGAIERDPIVSRVIKTNLVVPSGEGSTTPTMTTTKQRMHAANRNVLVRSLSNSLIEWQRKHVPLLKQALKLEPLPGDEEKLDKLLTLAFIQSGSISQDETIQREVIYEVLKLDETDHTRLEFLGDSILEISIRQDIVERRSYFGDANHLRSNATLIEYMTALSITDDFFINFSETTTLKFARDDIFESLMGAVYLSRGFYTAMPLYQNVIIPAVYAYAARFETKQES